MWTYNTLIWKVRKSSLTPLPHHSSSNAFALFNVVKTSTCCTVGGPLKQVSVSWRWSPQPATSIQKFMVFVRRLGGSCLQWDMMMTRSRWLDFNNVFPLTVLCEETRLGQDQFVQLMETLGLRASCYQIPVQWLLHVMCRPSRLLATAWL